jgi:hypothetical protein
VLRYFQGTSVVGGLFALTLVLVHSQVLFILLPVGLSVVLTAVTQRTELRNVGALILKTFVALVYFGAITGWELLTHAPGTPEIIVVTTTLAIAVVFEPLRTSLQAFLEQRFHLRDDATTKAVEAFTATLREEIDLNQVRERFLAVVQQILHPQTVSLRVRAPAHDAPESLPAPAAGALDERRLPGGAPADERLSLPQPPRRSRPSRDWTWRPRRSLETFPSLTPIPSSPMPSAIPAPSSWIGCSWIRLPCAASRRVRQKSCFRSRARESCSVC